MKLIAATMNTRHKSGKPREQRVLLLAKDDAECREISRALASDKLGTKSVETVEALCEQIARGAAAAVIADLALTDEGLTRIKNHLHSQSTWSDFPLIILTDDAGSEEAGLVRTEHEEILENAVLLERPVKMRSLASVVRIAVRSRGMQYARREEQREFAESSEVTSSQTTQLRERVREQSETLRLLRDVATASNFAASVEEALSFALAQVCRYTGWAFGHAFMPSADDPEVLTSVNASYEYASGRFRGLRSETMGMRIAKGKGLVGRVFASGQPEWTRTIEHELGSSRADLCADLGIVTAAAFPIMVGTEVVGVLEFFSLVESDPDPELLDAMTSVSTQLGRVIERDRMERAMRESYRLLEKIGETSPMMIRILDDVQQRYVHVNGRMAEFLGTTPEEAIQGGLERISAAVHPDDLSRYRQAKTEVRRVGRETPVAWQARMWNAIGEWRWVRSWSVAFTRGEDGTTKQILSISIDVTEQVEMEEKLRQTERLTSIGTLAAGIAHEVNNPLASVVMAAQLLLRRTDDVKSKEMLRNLINDAKRCGRIVRGVQKFARQEPSERTSQDLNAVVRAAEELSRNDLKRSGIRLKLDLTESLPPVSGDVTELEQVVLNLIKNAAHASKSGQEVVVQTANSDGCVDVRVRDDGHGMTADVKRHIFDPFFTTRGQQGGTGLGLSIIHGIVEDHGGRIDIDSEVGRGTTVTVSLPVESERH